MTKAKNVAPDFAALNDAMDKSGFEDINTSTMSIPFIKLLQALSPQLKKNKPEFIDGAKEGMFCNNVSGKLFEDGLRIVVGKFERFYLEWDAATRGKLVSVHSPESVELRTDLIRDEKNKLIDPTSKNVFQETYNYYIILPDHMDEGVCMLSISSTGIKEAKKLNRMLFNTLIPGSKQKALPYYMVFSMNIVELTNDQGDWNGIVFKLDSFVSQEALDCITEERKALPEKSVDYEQSGGVLQIETTQMGDEPPY